MTRIFKTETKEVTVSKEVGKVCHKCCSVIPADQTEEMFIHNFIGGYGSKFGDGLDCNITLCDSCAYDVLNPYTVYRDFCGCDEDYYSECKGKDYCLDRFCQAEGGGEGCSNLDLQEGKDLKKYKLIYEQALKLIAESNTSDD